MAKKVDFTQALGEMVEDKKEDVKMDQAAPDPKDTIFVLDKKQKKKQSRKTFPIYMEEETANKLDRICNKTGYTRNELINKMIDFCLNNIEIR